MELETQAGGKESEEAEQENIRQKESRRFSMKHVRQYQWATVPVAHWYCGPLAQTAGDSGRAWDSQCENSLAIVTQVEHWSVRGVCAVHLVTWSVVSTNR